MTAAVKLDKSWICASVMLFRSTVVDLSVVLVSDQSLYATERTLRLLSTYDESVIAFSHSWK